MARKRKRRRLRAVLWIALIIATGSTVNLYLALRPEALESRLRSALGALFVRADFDSFEVSLSRGIEIRGLRLLEGSAREGTVARVTRARVRPRLTSALLGDFQPARLVLEGVELNVNRGGRGGWNLERVLRPRQATGDPGPIPDVLIENGRVFYSDEYTFSRPVEQVVRNLRLSLSSRSSEAGFPVCAFEGELETDLARRLRVSGRLFRGPELGFEASLQAFKVDIGGSHARFLSAEAAEGLRGLTLAGHVDADVHVRFDGADGFRVERIEAALVRGGARLTSLPFPFQALGGRLSLRRVGGSPEESGGSVRGRILGGNLVFAGELGDGKVSGEFEVALDARRLEIREWSGRLEIRSIHVDPRQARHSSGELERFFARFRPRGKVDVAVTVPRTTSWAPELDDLTLSVGFRGAELQSAHFPYLLTDVQADFTCREGVVQVEPGARMRCGGGTLTIPEFLVEARPDGFVRVRLEAQDVLLDDRLREACPKGSHRIWDEFQPTGKANASILLEREKREGEAREPKRSRRPVFVRVEARPVDGRIRYRRFPYEVEGISGRFIVDSRERVILLKELKGVHGLNEIACDGEVKLGENGGADIQFRSADFAVDEALMAALPPARANVLRQFNFRGSFAVNSRVRTGSAGSGVTIEADLHEGEFRHSKFPFPVTLVAGRLTISGSNRITMAGLKTAEDARPRLVFEGEVDCQEDSGLITYGLDVQHLEVDERLKSSLPERLARFVSESGLAGTYEGRLEGEYRTFASAPEKNINTYRGIGVRSSDAAVDFGLKITGMKAQGDFAGVAGPGDHQGFEGDVSVHEARFNRLKLSNGRVLFVFGKPHPMVRGAERTEKLPRASYRLPADFKSRLAADKVTDTFQLSVSSGDMYGGRSDGFMYIDTGPHGDFAGDFVAEGIDVAKASSDVFGVKGADVGGTAEGEVRFEGKVGDGRSITGRGKGRIVKARLAEVPLFHGMVKLFGGSGGAYFHEMSLPYEIGEGHFRSNAIELKSAVMSLNGGGTLDFNGGLDLLLQPVFINIKIPVVDQLFFLVKKILSEVHVGGTLAQPQVKLVTAGVRWPLGSGAQRAGEDTKDGRATKKAAGKK